MQAPQDKPPQAPDVLKSLHAPYTLPDGKGISNPGELESNYGQMLDCLAAAGLIERCADLFITLRENLDESVVADSTAPLANELGAFIESAFRRSTAYKLAFAIYAGRFQMSLESRANDFGGFLARVIHEQGKALLFTEGGDHV